MNEYPKCDWPSTLVPTCPPAAPPTLRDELAQIEKRLIAILETLVVPYTYLDGRELDGEPRCAANSINDDFYNINNTINDISTCAMAIKNRIG